MEDLLLTIIQDANSARLTSLKDTTQVAYDKLINQQFHRDPSYDLRQTCFMALKLALDSKKQKFITHAINGVHRMMRDDRFFLTPEPEDDSTWFPAQLLVMTADMPITGNEENVVNMLRLFLAMACTPACTLNGRLLIDILQRCGECWEKGVRSVKAASLASASQCLRAFCNFLKEESEEIAKAAPVGTSSMSKGYRAAVYNEVIPLMQYLTSRINEINSGSPSKSETPSFQFLLECILTLTASIPKESQYNPHFTAFLWQKFCPNLAAVLGFPSRVNLDKKITYKEAIHIIESENRGFYIQKNVTESNSRCIYLTAIELLRIAGFQASLRPMLEALFHRMLLLPPTQNRYEPLKYVREIFKNPERVVDMSVLIPNEKTQSAVFIGSDDMALFRLIMDAMQECAAAAKNDVSKAHVLEASVECLVALLCSLQKLISESGDSIKIEDEVVKAVNARYVTIKQADYKGPLTYQMAVRLPKVYREQVAELRKGNLDGVSTSDSDVENPDPENVSINSGDTEGPEEEIRYSSDNDSAGRDERWAFGASDVWPDGDYDRHHARDFAKIITEDLVPKLILLKNTVEIDEYLQDFASNICQQNTSNFSDFDYNLTAINADGIYLATFSAILLGLQLTEAGHYDNPDKPIQIPLTEQQFVQSVQNSGILVCLSCSWLRELYQCVLSNNPLQHLKRQDMQSCALIDILYDTGGLGSEQMMTNWQKLQCVTRVKLVDSEQQNAGKKLARRLLTCCWDSMLEILTTGLSVIKESRSGRLMKLTKKPLSHEKSPAVNKKALYISSLDGLHAAATLTNALNLQHLSGKILHLIATNACQNIGPKIPVSQALSMKVVLTGALELGAQNPECWLPVFTICRHITKLEHALFSSQNNNSHVTGVSGRKGDSNNKCDSKDKDAEDLKLKYSTYSTDDDETAVDVYSFLQAPMSNPNTDVESILKSYQESTEILTLTETDTAKILCALSLQADSLFIEAADKLSLPSLCQFLKNLCRASRDQLNGNLITNKKDKDSKSTSWWDFTNWKQKVDKAPPSLLLHRIGDVTLKIFRGTRPLLHILKIWAITGPYLMDAACHKDRTISKKAIENIHDVIVAVLVEQTELPYFHFNEALMKPFENLMTMEQCDIDVVDQIIACLMSLVETYRVEIQSAWRPLFGTLRAARNRPVHLPNILDIFRVFLDWDNTIIFSYAGLDFIICLLSYLEVSSGNGDIDEAVKNKNLDFLHEVLKHLERCTLILEYMYNMPKCPNLLTSFKLNGINYTHLVDSTIIGSIDKFYYFGNRYFEDYEDQYMISYKALNVTDEELRNINELDKASGVLKVWFLLLDGLTNSLIVCPVAHQCMILQTIFKLFKQLKQSPGLEFGFYCLNHLLIPTIQDWVRYTNKHKKPWSPIEKNFKHCCGMTTDLVVEFIECSIDIQVYNRSMNHYRSNVGDDEEMTYRAGRARYSKSAVLALKQLLLVLVECASQSQETVARVGVSCMKHIIFSIGHNFEEEEWKIVTSAIHRAITVSSAPVKQLLLAFKRRSDSFYGDNATVKVVARNDTTFDEILRLKSLSDQVFLLDGQRESSSKKEISILDDRSYAFLLFSNLDGDPDQNLESYKVRIAYRSIVVGLLANQMLLQLIANILLGDLKNAPLELHNVIYDHYMSREKVKFEVDVKSREILLRCLRQYLTVSIEFDSRPGLKFLLQKIANVDHAPNLYKQLTSSFIIYFMTLVDAYLNDIKMYNLSLDDVRYVLDTCSNKNSNVVKKKEYFVKYLFLLKDIWNDISKLYLCLVNTVSANSNSNINNNNNNNESNNRDIVHVSLKAEGLSSSSVAGVTTTSSSTSLPTTASSCDEAIYSDNNQSPGNHSPAKQDPTDDNTSDYHSKRGSPDKQQAIPPEIEQQRQTSMFKDATFKRTVLAQLIKASMELLRFLPEQSTDNLKLLLTPAIKESFLIVEAQNL